jgi:hypothetical protein
MSPQYRTTPLWAIMQERGLTPGDLRSRTLKVSGRGMSALDIGDIAHGERAARPEELEILAAVLGLTGDELAGRHRTKRVARAIRTAAIAAMRRRRRGTVDVDDLAFWSDAYVMVTTTADGLHVQCGHGPTVRVPARAQGRTRGGGRPAGRRTAKASASSSDDDSDPEPPLPHDESEAVRGAARSGRSDERVLTPVRSRREDRSRDRGGLPQGSRRTRETSPVSGTPPKRLCGKCGSPFDPVTTRERWCPPCLRAVDRKRTGKRGTP